jgi:hypothetical protein
MPRDLRKKQNGVSRLFGQACTDKETFNTDEGITAPASHITCAEVGQSGTKTALKVFEFA